MAYSPSVTEELTCSICLELFEEPVLLPCAHTFCRQCLRNFCHKQQDVSKGEDKRNKEKEVEDSDSTILCPKCRAVVKLGKDGIAGLPKNTTLANIILSFEEGEGPKLKGSAPCDVCDTDPPRSGFKSCSDCMLTYCRACFAQLHPLRGAFTHHMITSPAFADHSDQWESEIRSPRPEKRVIGRLERVRSMSPLPKDQEYLERLRQSLNKKRRQLKDLLKDAQDLLKNTEDDTEDQMKKIKSTSCKLHEGVAQREGAMLGASTRRRHEAVTCCYAIISDAQAQTLELDLLEEKFGQILVKGPAVDISHELSCLEERLAVLDSTPMCRRLNDVPRPRAMHALHVQSVLKDMDFLPQSVVPAPVITDILPRPVAKGPAVIDVRWAGPEEALTYRLTAYRKTQKGRTERVTVDDVTGGSGSQVMMLPGVDAQYRLVLSITSVRGEEGAGDCGNGLDHPINSEEKIIRTLPYVNCLPLRFDPTQCHKTIAVTSSREEVTHRKCKLANLSDTYPPSSATTRRLEELEGVTGDNSLPALPHMYWECVVHFHIISKMDDSKLICDLGICKVGMEDHCSLVCDNHKAYCCYLVKRHRHVMLEFWNGPNQQILPRSVPVAHLDKENEKTLRLGFYLDTNRKVFAVLSPGSSTILAQFHVKFTSLQWVVGLYCPDQVYASVKMAPVNNLPLVLAKLLARPPAADAAEGDAAP